MVSEMANPLFSLMSKQNPMANFMQRLQQLKQTVKDPNEQIQQLLNSGKVSQADYNRAVQTAQELQRFIK